MWSREIDNDSYNIVPFITKAHTLISLVPLPFLYSPLSLPLSICFTFSLPISLCLGMYNFVPITYPHITIIALILSSFFLFPIPCTASSQLVHHERGVLSLSLSFFFQIRDFPPFPHRPSNNARMRGNLSLTITVPGEFQV
jgi:hypothetical protein